MIQMQLLLDALDDESPVADDFIFDMGCIYRAGAPKQGIRPRGCFVGLMIHLTNTIPVRLWYREVLDYAEAQTGWPRWKLDELLYPDYPAEKLRRDVWVSDAREILNIAIQGGDIAAAWRKLLGEPDVFRHPHF